jgi:hypothetical protein
VTLLPEAVHTIVVVAIAGAALLAMIAWLSIRALRIPSADPNRLVAELRLAQLAAVVLAFVSAAYVGLAVAQPAARGGGLDVAIALGFLIIAVTAPMRDPHEALGVIALAFVAHAVGDVLHRPGWLLEALVPAWYAAGCAAQNGMAAALCYLPVWRR